MATTTAPTKTPPPVSPEEHAKRVNLARAMFNTELGDAKPKDRQETQAAFNEARKEMIGKAIRVKKTLERLGYEIIKKK